MPAQSQRPPRAADELYPSWQDQAAMPSDPWWLAYARLSVAEDSDQTGVERQLDDCFAYARRAGARRIAFRADDGIGAWKTATTPGGTAAKKKRDAFEQVLHELTASEARVVVAWKAERLARRPRDAERLLDALGDIGQARGRVLTVADGVDSDTEAGRLVFRLMVQFGEWESASISRRVGRKHQALAESGHWSGSGRAFGHRLVREKEGATLVVEPAEADLIREAAARVLAGEGLVSIRRDWGSRGIMTTGGKPWQHSQLRRVLTSARMVGLRVLRGVEGSGHIEPILDRADWERACRILNDPARKPAPFHDGKPRHLLTNLMRCGKCAGPLRAKGNAGKNNGPGYWTYGCIKDPAHPAACGGVWIKGQQTDAYVEALTVALLAENAKSRPADAPDPQAADRAALLALVERIGAIEAAVLRGTLEADFGVGMDGYRAWRKEALRQRDELEARVSAAARVVRLPADLSPEAAWAAADLSVKRAIVRELWEEITVFPAVSVSEFPQRWDKRRIRMLPAE